MIRSRIISWYFNICNLDGGYVVNDNPIINVHVTAVLAFIDMFHREHRTSYAKDVETLKSLVGEAILLEDLDKGI